MEKNDDVKGEGNSYTTQFRQYDPRLGRWKSLDPLASKYPNTSPYTSMNNNPIFIVDKNGAEVTDWGRNKKDGSYKWYDTEAEAKSDLGDDFGGYFKPGEVYTSGLGNKGKLDRIR